MVKVASWGLKTPGPKMAQPSQLGQAELAQAQACRVGCWPGRGRVGTDVGTWDTRARDGMQAHARGMREAVRVRAGAVDVGVRELSTWGVRA